MRLFGAKEDRKMDNYDGDCFGVVVVFALILVFLLFLGILLG
jgi:hypothetical protein